MTLITRARLAHGDSISAAEVSTSITITRKTELFITAASPVIRIDEAEHTDGQK